MSLRRAGQIQDYASTLHTAMPAADCVSTARPTILAESSPPALGRDINMTGSTVKDQSRGRNAAFWIGIVLLFLVPTTIWYPNAHAQCIDYSDYLHWRASVDTPGVENSVAVYGDHAFVAAGAAGLQVVDITDPNAPLIVGHVDTPGDARDVVVSDGFAYVTDSFSGLQVIDVQSPELPVIVGYVDTPGIARAVALAGSYAYVADEYKGLQVIDITVPTAPTIVGSLETTYSIDVAVSGAYAYVAPGMQVIDISNPAVPVVVGSVNKPNWAVRGIDVHDGYAYAAAYEMLQNNQTKSTLDIIDIASPTSPVIVGSVQIFGRPADVAVSGAVAFVADGIGLTTVDITDPISPKVMGSVRKWSSGLAGEGKIAVSGSTAYVAGSAYGLHLFAVTKPASPPVLARMDTPGYAVGVALSPPYAYVADYEAGISVIDVTNPLTPAIVGTLDTPGRVTDIVIAGTYAYVADDSAGFKVLDITSPASPQIVGSVLTDARVFDLALSGSHVYLADGAGDLEVIDVSDPESPVWVTTLVTPGMSYGVDASGSYAYVAGDAGLQVVDISNPALPEIVGSVNTPGTTLAVSNAFVYMTHYDFGLHVIDVSNPASPALVGNLMLENSGEVTALGSVLYVGAFGLEVVDITNPMSPFLRGSVPGASGATAISGSNAFVAAGNFVALNSQCEIPTPVALANFRATVQPGAVLLEWVTSFETELSGFHVLRSVHGENKFERITSELIQAPYRFLDSRVIPGTTYDYSLEAVDRSGRTERMGLVSVRTGDVMRSRLGGARPNPFAMGATEISFTLAKAGPVLLRILDISGRQVRVLFDESMETGERSVIWDGKNDRGELMPGGVYLYTIDAPGLKESRRVVKLR